MKVVFEPLKPRNSEDASYPIYVGTEFSTLGLPEWVPQARDRAYCLVPGTPSRMVMKACQPQVGANHVKNVQLQGLHWKWDVFKCMLLNFWGNKLWHRFKNDIQMSYVCVELVCVGATHCGQWCRLCRRVRRREGWTALGLKHWERDNQAKTVGQGMSFLKKISCQPEQL